MSVKEAKRRDEDAPSQDILYGAEEIGRYIGRPARWVYHQQRNLNLGHIGATLIGSKTKLTKLLTGEAA
jgi:hypothetical protein